MAHVIRVVASLWDGWCFTFKAVRQKNSLTQEKVCLFVPFITARGWGPYTPGCFIQPADLNVSLTWKCPHENTQNDIWPDIWVSSPAQFRWHIKLTIICTKASFMFFLHSTTHENTITKISRENIKEFYILTRCHSHVIETERIFQLCKVSKTDPVSVLINLLKSTHSSQESYK